MTFGSLLDLCKKSHEHTCLCGPPTSPANTTNRALAWRPTSSRWVRLRATATMKLTDLHVEHRRPSAGDAFTQTRTELIAPPKLFSFLFLSFFSSFFSLSLTENSTSKNWPKSKLAEVDRALTNFPLNRWCDKRNHDSAAKQTITSTSVDIKTQFENFKLKCVAEIVDNHCKHESFATTLVRRMSGLDGKTILHRNLLT